MGRADMRMAGCAELFFVSDGVLDAFVVLLVYFALVLNVESRKLSRYGRIEIGGICAFEVVPSDVSTGLLTGVSLARLGRGGGVPRNVCRSWGDHAWS
jgi:hypothetical protein